MKTVKKYDLHCQYQEGDILLVQNRLGHSLATVLQVVRRPELPCDKGLFQFHDLEFAARWREEGHGFWFAIDHGRQGLKPVSILTDSDGKKKRVPIPKEKKVTAIPLVCAEPLPQAEYRRILEQALQSGITSIDEVKALCQEKLPLGPADWYTGATGKTVWIHRLHGAIKHLIRFGVIESPERGVYRWKSRRKTA